MTQERRLARLLQKRWSATRASGAQSYENAAEVVVFGSRAAGVHSWNSDLDVLVVGGTDRIKRSGLDIVPVPLSAITDPAWLESELATHVAAYGVWLRGAGDWRQHAHVGFTAAETKATRVARLVINLRHYWFHFDESFRKKYALTLRREIQRWGLLRRAMPVPPTALLDRSSSMDVNEVVNAFDLRFSIVEKALLRELLRTHQRDVVGRTLNTGSEKRGPVIPQTTQSR